MDGRSLLYPMHHNVIAVRPLLAKAFKSIRQTNDFLLLATIITTMTSVPLHRALPEPELIKRAAEVEVLDKQGDKVRFGDLFRDQTTIVVFIRASRGPLRFVAPNR